MEYSEMALRLGTALVLGALAGCDREMRGKPAGLKTFSLVSLGAATFTLITLSFMEQQQLADPNGRSWDPIRLVAGIVGGIGFLGAGTIFHAKGSIEGITTAAGIWIVGAIGMACGAGFYVIATMAFIGTAFILLPVAYLQQLLIKKPKRNAAPNCDCDDKPSQNTQAEKPPNAGV